MLQDSKHKSVFCSFFFKDFSFVGKLSFAKKLLFLQRNYDKYVDWYVNFIYK